MGAIAGRLSFDRHARMAAGTVERLLDAAAPRTLAAAGSHRFSYLGQGVALGACSGEPASALHAARNESGTVRAVADSALSNGSSLRRLLEDRGHRFRTASDAELAAHAYEEWGDACVERFAGPFAVAIWDRLRRRLLLARDAFGLRPLCYAVDGEGVAFASEATALLPEVADGNGCRPEAIDAYLTAGYVPAPMTIYRGINKLEPAHTLVVDGRRLATRAYWTPSAVDGCCAREAIDVLDRRLGAALASIDAAGSCLLLSGGLASTALATKLPFGSTTVSVGIGQDTADLDRAHHAAAHLGLDNRLEVAVPDGVELAALLAWLVDEPVADPAAVSLYTVLLGARRHATLAATGHGADAPWVAASAAPIFDEGSRRDLYTRRFAWELAELMPPGDPALAGPGRRASRLAVAGRAAAAVGIDLAHPLVDRELDDLAMALRMTATPPGAALLRHLISRCLPERLAPPVRRPLVTPRWLSTAVRTLVPRVLLGDRFDSRGVVRRDALSALWDEHVRGRGDHARRLWALLMLELWFREFVDGDPAAQPADESVVLVRAA